MVACRDPLRELTKFGPLQDFTEFGLAYQEDLEELSRLGLQVG